MMNQTLSKPENVEQLDAKAGCSALPCSRLFLVRGVPGSGKTTYAKTLGIADHYEADMWFEQNGGYDPSKIKMAHEWCQKQALAAMRSGRDVVVSNTFTRLWEMQPYEDAARKLGVEVIEKVMNGEWPNVHGVPADKVRQMRQRFEYANKPLLRTETRLRIKSGACQDSDDPIDKLNQTN